MTKKPLVALAAVLLAARAFAADPLPSWNDTAPKRAIVQFVERVTKEGSADFVPAPERIATFDNDGTLWSEQPMYFQLFFVAARVKALAPPHPEWKTTEPFASLLKGDLKGVAASGEKGLAALVAATHAGMLSWRGTRPSTLSSRRQTVHSNCRSVKTAGHFPCRSCSATAAGISTGRPAPMS